MNEYKQAIGLQKILKKISQQALTDRILDDISKTAC